MMEKSILYTPATLGNVLLNRKEGSSSSSYNVYNWQSDDRTARLLPRRLLA